MELNPIDRQRKVADGHYLAVIGSCAELKSGRGRIKGQRMIARCNKGIVNALKQAAA